ncbi:MAG: thioredoxin domain-containing protein [Acetobacteraceae bacterium]|nr:thioredoxin domain-containing protein [Acetobacteraceae bacterium]
MKLLLRSLALLSCACLLAAPARAEEFTPAQRAEIVAILRDALRQDPSILRDAIGALQTEEGQRQQAATRAAITANRDMLVTPNDPIAGNPKGDVTIVEFFDTRCPYCRKLEPSMAQFLSQDRGVRLVYKDLPILGPASVLGSRALLAAKRQGAYEKMREAVMKMPPDNTTPAMIQSEAQKLGLDTARLVRDMEDPALQQQIDANLKLAHALEIQGTPALIIGSELVPGAVEVPELKRLVAQARAQ